MSVTVYTAPGCKQCLATFRTMDKKGIDYAKVDVTESPEAEQVVRSLGYRQLPVIVAGDVPTEDNHWGGFNPGRIAALVA